MIIALASPRVAADLEDGLRRMERLIGEASGRRAEVVCFPEAYLPGLRGLDFDVAPFDEETHVEALARVQALARAHHIAVIAGMEKVTAAGRQIAAVVIDPDGRIQGEQTKVQLDPAEERHYVAGRGRHIFTVNGLTFGIAICHEGFRYPETVRWAATRGAKVVFHPHLTGSDRTGVQPAHWADPRAPYYEKAMTMRAIENSIYFASVNYAMRFQESATALIDPDGVCVAHLPYGGEGVLVQAIDPDRATGALAARFAPDRY